MSYVRRRNSVHYHINGHRIRKDAFWRWISVSSLILFLILLGAAWTFYSKDQMVHQAASRLMDIFFR